MDWKTRAVMDLLIAPYGCTPAWIARSAEIDRCMNQIEGQNYKRGERKHMVFPGQDLGLKDPLWSW